MAKKSGKDKLIEQADYFARERDYWQTVATALRAACQCSKNGEPLTGPGAHVAGCTVFRTLPKT